MRFPDSPAANRGADAFCVAAIAAADRRVSVAPAGASAWSYWRRPAATARVCAALLLIGGLAGCGGGGDDGAMEAAVAAGNAGQIRKEYFEAVGRDVATAPSGEAGDGGGTPDAGSQAEVASDPPRTASLTPAVSASDAPAAAPATLAADGAPAMTPAGNPPTSDDPVALGFRQAALDAINAARAQSRQCGDRAMPAVGPLQWNPRVAYAALLESEWMLDRNTFGHAWDNGELVWDRLMMAGYLWQAADENIAAGFDTLADAMKAWVDSPPHCVALMRADLEDVGVAVLPGRSDSRYSSYWTMAFGTLKRIR